MIKTQIIGHLAHDNKLFDVQCTKCFMMYDSKTLNGLPGCPKCHSPLGSIYTKKGRAMAISEGTIYPTLTEADKAQEAENVAKRKNAMPITHRFVLFSFANTETGILEEPPVHQYLATGREIMIEVGHNPIASWYKAKDQSIKLELRYIIMYHKGDKIQLLGRKEVANTVQPVAVNQAAPIGVAAVNNAMAPIPQTSPNTAATATNLNPAPGQVDPAVLAVLQAQLNALVASQNTANAAPGPVEAPIEVEAQQSLFPTNADPFA